MATDAQSGILFLVSTPIGNLTDLSPRAVETLRQSDLILAEDTRRARILLEHAGVASRPVRFDEHAEHRSLDSVLAKLLSGAAVALISDAGTPTIADPGFRLVRACIDRGIRISTVPGPSAAVAALSVSGLPTDRFLFAGYPPRRSGPRRRFFEDLRDIPATLVFYESPHRIAACLRDACETLGDRRAVLVRELTKMHEEIRRASLCRLASETDDERIRGEIVLVVEGTGRRGRDRREREKTRGKGPDTGTGAG